MSKAKELAAQCWCFPETENIEMDVRLAEAFTYMLDPILGELGELKHKHKVLQRDYEVMYLLQQGEEQENQRLNKIVEAAKDVAYNYGNEGLMSTYTENALDELDLVLSEYAPIAQNKE